MPDKRVKESFYRDKLANSIPGSKTEVRCDHGFIDVLTSEEVIEVKRIADWKSGVGQLATYGMFYRTHKLRLHLLVPSSACDQQIKNLIEPACNNLGIKVTCEYECDRAIALYKVGPITFRSQAEIENYVACIRSSYFTHKASSLQPEHKEFMLDLLNRAPWVKSRFKGVITNVRIIGNKFGEEGRLKQIAHFQAKSESCGWLDIKITNYLEFATKNASFETIYIPKKVMFTQ